MCSIERESATRDAAGVIVAVIAAVVLSMLSVWAGYAGAASCGGSVVCACGDNVTQNYTMTADLDCGRLPMVDTVGLKVKSGATLDCAGHTISGPADTIKSAFGVKITGSVPVTNVTVRNCVVTGFWWGVHVDNAGSNVRIENNHLLANGWKSLEENGTGYGLNVSNSTGVTVQDNLIVDSGNEGFHLSASTGVSVLNNTIKHSGREQLYLIHSDGNTIRGNRAVGGTQGLEMRWSSNNVFSYNEWVESPLQYLENDDMGNTFRYERFEGQVSVGTGSTGNSFELSEFVNPTGKCLVVVAPNDSTIEKSFFRSCGLDVYTTASVLLERSVNTLSKVSKSVTVRFPGCTADIDRDAVVGEADRAAVLAAMGTVPGDLAWNPEADLDHDGDVDAADLAVLDAQVGPCTANLVVTALSDPADAVVPGGALTITDTVQNQSAFAAGTSRTQYYLSVDQAKGLGDRLIGGRSVPALVPGGVSTATVSAIVPTSTPVGTYYLVACADDTGLVPESGETDNCRASTRTVRVGRPDLMIAAVDNPPPAVGLGGRFTVSDTAKNQSVFPAGASRVQFYLSLDTARDSADRLLSGSRSVLGLIAGATSTGPTTLTVPINVTPGTYYLLACADDLRTVIESDETNNCRPAATGVQIGKPDLVTTAVSNPPASIGLGKTFVVTDTVANVSPFAATAFRVQYYLSLDGLKNTGDRLLSGFRSVTGLAPNATSPGSVTVTVPPATATGSYLLLACVDDGLTVAESDETNNCLASTGRVTVGP